VPDALPPWILDARRQLGRRIQARRLHQNLTQERLRDLTDLSVDTIHRIETGRADAKFSQLLRIARALDVPVSRLLED
jgi:transcriptional regulator with XRE-family HTH domain